MDALVRLAKKDNPQVGKIFFKGKMKKNRGNSEKIREIKIQNIPKKIMKLIFSSYYFFRLFHLL